MKRSLPILLTLAILTGGVAQAQTSTPPQSPDQSASTSAQSQRGHSHHHPDAARQVKHLTKKLGLTADQAAQLQPILANREQKMQALETNAATLDPKSLHQQRHAIAVDTDQKLNAILTADQQQQYSAMKAAHHHGHGKPQSQPSAS